MRAELADVERIEDPNYPLTDEWAQSVAKALGVGISSINDPNADIAEIWALSRGLAAPPTICPIAARYAILGLIAKFGGVRMANDIPADDLGRVIQIFYAFVEGPPPKGGVLVNRPKIALQIAVLTFLQARDHVPGSRFEDDLDTALEGALVMIERFSTLAPRKLRE